MDKSVTNILSQIPDDLFFSEPGKPDYRRAMYEVVRAQYEPTPEKAGSNIPIEDFLSPSFPNPATVQRATAREARRREGVPQEAFPLAESNRRTGN